MGFSVGRAVTASTERLPVLTSWDDSALPVVVEWEPARHPIPVTRSTQERPRTESKTEEPSLPIVTDWEATRAEIAEAPEAARPARMTLTGGRRGRSPKLVEASAPEDPFEVQTTEPLLPRREVVESLPGQFVAGTRSAVANLRRMAAEESTAQREEVLKPGAPSPTGARVSPKAIERQERQREADLSARAQAEADAAQARRDLAMITPPDQTTIEQALSSLAQSSGPTTLGLAAGILTRNIPLAMALAGGGGAAMEAGGTYGEARERGATHRAASLAATIDGLLEGVGEALPIGVALKPCAPVLTRILNTIAAEAGQETATQFAQDLRAKVMEHPDLTLGEMWRNLKVAALAGAGGGAVYGGAGAAADASRARTDRALATLARSGAEDSERSSSEESESPSAPTEARPQATASARRPEGTNEAAVVERIEAAARESATSPANALPEPTDAQKAAGNYRKGKVSIDGLEIAIENPRGSERSGVDGGAPWQVTMTDHYGYVKGSEGRDGDQVDVYLRSGSDPTTAPVYVIDQRDLRSGEFDEHKAVLGARSAEEAAAIYDHHFSDGKGPQRRGTVVEMSFPEFKAWVSDGRTKAPIAGQKVGRKVTAQAPGPHAAAMAAQAANSWAPGANYVPLVDDASLPTSAGGTALSGKPIRRENVLIPFLKALDAPIYEGRVKGQKRLGYYLPKKEAVRIKKKSDLEVAAHEIAHLIDDRVFNGFGTRKGVAKTRPWAVGPNAATYARELAGVSYDASKVYEGWAEYVRLWMTQPERASAVAPEFTKWFDNFFRTHEYGPALLMARQGMTAWYGQDALNRARSKIGPSRSLNEFLEGFWDQFRQATVDDLHGIYRMERSLRGGVEPLGAYETARTTRAAYAMVDGALRYGHPVRKADGSTEFRGKGLEAILKPVANDLEGFTLYATGRSAQELTAQGRERLFTKTEIEAMLALRRPEFDRAFLEYQAWNMGVVDFAQALGIINPETRALWRRVQYLPFHRVRQPGASDRAGGVAGNWSGIHQLVGGTGNIRDVLGNMVQNASMLITEALRNEARAKVAALADREIGGGRFMVRIAPESKKFRVDRTQVRDQLLAALGAKDAGPAAQAVRSVVDSLIAESPAFFEFFMHGQAPRGDNVVAVMKDGKPAYYEVADPLLYRAFSALHRPAQSSLVRVLGLPKRIGQASITLTPDFAAANIVRDALMGAVMSRAGFVPAIDSIRGLTGRLRQDSAYREYLANGGGFASYFVDPEGEGFRKHLERFYRAKALDARTILDTPSKVLHALETIFDSFEAATRIGEYKRARARGEHPRHAAYLAREISTDFAMKGDSQALGFLYDTVMFLRPAVVSMDRLFRGVAHDPNRGAIMAKSAAIALLSAALYLLNRGRPEFDDLEEWNRDNYWHFFVPRPDGETLHFRIPKIWEVGALATLAERAAERTIEQAPAEYAKDFARVVTQQFGLNLMPQILAPLYEQATNRDTFTKRPIVPPGLERVQPFLRAKPGTSETMKALGMATRELPEAFQVDPVRAEALLTGYLNTWAFYGLLLSDEAFFGDRLPERRLDQLPVARRFYRQEPALHTKHETRFYELLAEGRRLRGTMRELSARGNEDLAYAVAEEPLFLRAGQLEAASGRVRSINRRMEAVRRDPALSRSDKRARLDDLTRERNREFREALAREPE